MLTVNNLYKKFGQREVLHGISFSVAEGQIVGLLGPNGAGKTTTMRIITGFLSPSRGKVLVNQRDITHSSSSSRLLFGYLPENNPLYEFLTPYEYLEFVHSLRNKKRDNSQPVEQIVKVCGLTEVARDKIEILSRGYKQRVGLAAALVGNPPLLVLDEPTVGLDPNQKEEIKKLIKKLKKTILFSSHILPEVKDLCQQVVIIHQGRVMAQGKISQLTKRGGVALEVTLRLRPRQSLKKAREEIEREFATLNENVSFPRSSRSTLKIKITRPKKASEIRKIIWQLCQKNDWQLYELKESEKSLDEIFQKLTRS